MSIEIIKPSAIATPYALAIGNSLTGGTVGKQLTVGAGNILSEATIATPYALAIGNSLTGGTLNQYLRVGAGNTLTQGVPTATVAINDVISGSTTRQILYTSGGILAQSNQLIFNANSSVILGGTFNVCASDGSSVVAGTSNTNNGIYSCIGGGSSNTLQNNYATISGGYLNTVQTAGDFATVGGGQSNLATANYTTIVGGVGNNATAESATAIGRYAKAYLFGQIAMSSNRFASTGDSQNSIIQSKRTSSDVTGATMEATTSGAAPAASNYILPTNLSSWFIQSSYVAIVTVITGIATGITVGDAWSGLDIFQAKRIGGVTTLSSVTSSASKQMVTTPAQYVASVMAYTVGGGNQIVPTLTFPTFAGGGSITVRLTVKMDVTEVYY
ncbi:hypothetical protein LBMAG19_6120 [Candidatus Pelagibacterales bacterium]|nr:hypothetical protein LBMAG19_6120 [Pelagibacterales bacterium]